ncbi:MAG: hypothetical protein HY821_02410 [Acidobacteria bacterium]|nr:hypothetical protein [Acidobacteriota bacterium]
MSARLLLAACIIAPALSAADSVFADNAFTGRWDTQFEPVTFTQLKESEGAALMNSMKAGATAACPTEAEKREFYKGVGSRTSILIYACTNGNRIAGVLTNVSEGLTSAADFASDAIAEKAGAFNTTISIGGLNQRVSFTYADSPLLPTLVYAQPDAISFLSSVPRRGTALRQGDPNPAFSGVVRFKLYRTKAATMVVTLEDSAGVLRESAAVPAVLSDDVRDSGYLFELYGYQRTATYVSLRAELRSAAGVVLARSSTTYAVYPPRGVVIAPEAIALNKIFPFPGGFGYVGEAVSVTDFDNPIEGLTARAEQTGPGKDWLEIGDVFVYPDKHRAFVALRVRYSLLASGLYWNRVVLRWGAGERVVPVTLQYAVRRRNWVGTAPEALSFSAREGEGSNESVNVKVGLNWQLSPVAGWNAVQLPPSLVEMGPPVDLQTGTPLAPDQGFSVKLNPLYSMTAGSRSTVLRVTAPDAEAVAVPVSTRISPVNEELPPKVFPASLGFRQTRGADGQVVNAPAQLIRVDCSSRAPILVTARPVPYVGTNWLRVSPGDGDNAITACSSTQTGAIAVSIDPLAVPAQGSAAGQINLYSGSRIIAVRVDYSGFRITVSGNGGKPPAAGAKRAEDACVPSALRVSESELPGGFSVQARGFVPLAVKVSDDCGNPVGGASVAASFSNGDSSLQLQGDGQGNFTATWQPLIPFEKTTVTLQAAAEAMPAASLDIEGEIVPADDAIPSIDLNGILNALNPQPGAPLSPGMIVEIRGQNLAAKEAVAEEPWPTSLEGAQVEIGGVAAPIFAVSPTRIVTQIPSELQPGESYQLLLSFAENFAKPETLLLGAAEPGLAASADGRLTAQHGDGELVSAANPARPGEVLKLFATGLGATDPPVPAGRRAAAAAVRTRALPRISVDGAPAEVLSSCLSAEKPGIYEVLFRVPGGVRGGAAELRLEQNGAAGNAVRLMVAAGTSN